MSHLVARTQAIPIDAVECSPHHASQSLLAYSAGQRITVSQWSADPDDDGAGKPIAAGIRALRCVLRLREPGAPFPAPLLASARLVRSGAKSMRATVRAGTSGTFTSARGPRTCRGRPPPVLTSNCAFCASGHGQRIWGAVLACCGLLPRPTVLAPQPLFRKAGVVGCRGVHSGQKRSEGANVLVVARLHCMPNTMASLVHMVHSEYCTYSGILTHRRNLQAEYQNGT